MAKKEYPPAKFRRGQEVIEMGGHNLFGRLGIVRDIRLSESGNHCYLVMWYNMKRKNRYTWTYQGGLNAAHMQDDM